MLPLAAGAHPATTGEFTILTFPDLIAPDVVYLENMTSDLYVEREAKVYRYGLAFGRLRGLALTAVRDSKDRPGPVLIFTPDEWQAFVTGLKHNTGRG
jgi:hypothetical protein